GGGVLVPRGVRGGAEELPGGIGDAARECAAASLAGGRFPAATVSCWLGAGARPCPRADPASRLPPVAAPAPSSQAPRPARNRALTRPRFTQRTLRVGKAALKRFGRETEHIAGNPGRDPGKRIPSCRGATAAG